MKNVLKRILIVTGLALSAVSAAALGAYIGIAWQGKAHLLNAEIVALFSAL